MTYDKSAFAKRAAKTETVGLDPVLKQQLETELHAGYAFNAKHAKKFRPFVWVPALLTIGSGLAAIGAVIGGIYILAAIGSNTPWFLWIGAAVPFGLLAAFFRLMWQGVSKAQTTAEAMADQYKSDMGSRAYTD
ncbi:MAG: hypothetical protein AAGL90_13375 [Pseudomonadota bacterium]